MGEPYLSGRADGCQMGYHRKSEMALGGLKIKLPVLAWPSDYYPLLIFQVGSDGVPTRSPRAIKRDFRALGQLVNRSGAQVVSSSVPSFSGNDEERKQEEPADQYMPPEPVVTGRSLDLLIMGHLA